MKCAMASQTRWEDPTQHIGEPDLRHHHAGACALLVSALVRQTAVT